MTTSQFVQIKKTAKAPMFKDLVGLTPNNKTSELIDFMIMLHPNQCKEAQGNTGKVFTSKNSYSFAMFDKGILRTNIYTEAKTFYSF